MAEGDDAKLDPLSWVFLALLIVSVLMTAFFSATETAFACLNKYRFKAKALDGDRTAKLVVRLAEKFDTTLISVLIGNNVFAILVSLASTLLTLRIFRQLGAEAWYFNNNNWISLLVSILMAFVVFLFGDTIPKVLAKKIPDRVASAFVWPMAFFVLLFYPLGLLFRGLSCLAKKIFKAKEDPELTEEDFVSAIDEGEKLGVFEENESDIIQASLEFDDTSVKEILTPIKKAKMLDLSGLTNEKLLQYLQKCPYSRIPCYVKDPNKVVGILVVKTYLSAYFVDPKISYISCLQKPYFVSPSVKIDDLVKGFRDHRTEIALVRKQGKILGMVTTEDVLEELVGKIAEKGDLQQHEAH